MFVNKCEILVFLDLFLFLFYTLLLFAQIVN